jgi:hypothetical protein
LRSLRIFVCQVFHRFSPYIFQKKKTALVRREETNFYLPKHNLEPSRPHTQERQPLSLFCTVCVFNPIQIIESKCLGNFVNKCPWRGGYVYCIVYICERAGGGILRKIMNRTICNCHLFLFVCFFWFFKQATMFCHFHFIHN